MSTGRMLHLSQGLALAAILLGGPAGAWADAIHLGNGTEPESLDVHQSSGVSEANIQRDLFEGLVAEGPDASLIPGAAERWEISQDGTVYTFHLRQDGRWSNGDPVTAGDFVYAFHRGLAPETAAAYAFILYPVANAEQFVGGEISEYTKLQAESREQALLRMQEDAERMGADAIVSVRLQTSMIMQGASELLAYGTAVKLR